MATKKPASRTFLQAYVERLPEVAASLTTAAVLFVMAVIFQPTIQRLFSSPARDYPLSCTADPVSLDPAHEQARAAFFIVNRGSDALDAAQLRQKLEFALDRSVGPGGTTIPIAFGPYDGKFVSAVPDAEFNGDKGVLHIERADDRIAIAVERIEAGAILKVDVVWTQSPLPPAENFTRDTKGALPFGQREYETACHSA